MKLKKNKKLNLVLLIAFLLVIMAAIYFITKIISYKKYDEYSSKVENYGFNILYNNEMSKSYQSITKLEALKLVLAASMDSVNINNYVQVGDSEEEKWISYALKKGIISNDDVDNLNNRVTYLDVIKYISNAKYYILNEMYNTELEPSFKDYNDYEQKDKINIMDMISSGIIDNNTNNFNGQRNLVKGEVNKLVIKFYEKFVIAKDYGTIRDNKEESPSNVADYPFVLKEVDNEVYEQNFNKDTAGEIIEPVEYYGEMKEYYNLIKETCENYYSIILNVDYRTINEQEFKKAVQKTTIDIIDDYSIKLYVDYVKENQIILSGKATVQMPIIYNDGFYSRARTKLEFTVENSNTMDNILFLDLNSGNKINYKDKKVVLYVDSLLSATLSSNKPYMKLKFIKDIILDMSKNNVTIEELKEEGE